MNNYQAFVVRVQELTHAEREAMAALYLAHYDCGSKELFAADLDAKSQTVVVKNAGRVIGFSTMQLYEFVWRGRPVRVVYSGDTVVDRSHWGQQALAFNWIAHMGELRRQAPDIPLYWFLIVKGHRTYRYLPTFSKSFYPHWSDARADLKQLADTLARDKFGDRYDADTGVVAFAESRGQLKPEIAYPKDGDLRHIAVRYFLERNPGYLQGHELVCICELSEDNLKPLARRIFARGEVCPIRGCA